MVNPGPTVVFEQTDKKGNIYISDRQTNEVMNAQQVVLVSKPCTLEMGDGNEDGVPSFTIGEKLAFTFLQSIQGMGHDSQPASYSPDYCSSTVCEQEN